MDECDVLSRGAALCPSHSAFVAAAVVVVVVVGVVVAGGGCDKTVPFAEVAVLVREPEDVDRRSDDLTNLFWQVDDADEISVSFEQGVAPKTAPIELHDQPHTLRVRLSVGLDLDAPKAAGKAAPIAIPSVNDVVEGALQEFTAPMLLAKPGVPEPLDTLIPAARDESAACDQRDGKGWVLAGVDGTGPVEQSYTFKNDELIATDAFGFDADSFPGGNLACDGDDDGQVVLWEPQEARLRLDASDRDTKLDASASGAAPVGGAGKDVDPFVRVFGASIWYGVADGIGVMTRAGTVKATLTLPLRTNVHFVVVDENTVVRYADEGVDVVRFDGRVLEVAEADAVAIVAVDANNNLALTTENNLVAADVGAAGTATFNVIRQIDIDPQVKPTEILQLSDGRIVAFDTVNDRLAFEGQPGSAFTTRAHMILTVGDAVILLGGDPGHDVVIPPDP